MKVRTKGDVSDVVPDGGVRALQLQRRLPVAEQHLRGTGAGSPTLFELLRTEYANTITFGVLFLFYTAGKYNQRVASRRINGRNDCGKNKEEVCKF